MTDRIDHVAEARTMLHGAGDGRNLATDASNAAVAHAVLALTEQQRIANVLKVEEISLRAQGWQPPLDIAAALGIDGVQS